MAKAPRAPHLDRDRDRRFTAYRDHTHVYIPHTTSMKFATVNDKTTKRAGAMRGHFWHVIEAVMLAREHTKRYDRSAVRYCR